MKHTKFGLILLLVFIALVQSPIHSQSSRSGILAGRVLNAADNEPLPGTNIILVGSVMGTISDLNGTFELPKIPPGTYQVKATMMGFKPQTKSVEIQAGQRAQLEFRLEETVIETAPLVVTATKRRQSIQDSPSSMSVVTSKDMERLNEAYLDQALKNAPGVHFSVSNVNIRGSSGFSRGAGSRVLLLVDGIPLMPGDSGDIKWDIIPTSHVKQVEIVKSAGSALYGSYALGGIINVITKEPSEAPTSNFRLAAGIHDEPYWPEWRWTNRRLHFTQIDASHSRSWGKLNLLISANKRQDTGYSQNSHVQNWGALSKLRYSFSPQTYLNTNARWTYRRGGELILWKNQHDALLVPDESVGQESTSSKFNSSTIFRKVVNQKFAYKVQLAYLHNWWRTDFPDHTDKSTADNVRVEGQFDLEPTPRHSLTTGSEIMLDFVKANIFGNHDALGWAFYLQDEYKILQNVALTSGIRYDVHQINQSYIDQEWSPKLGLVFKPGLFTSIRASVGRGFRAPTMAEMFTSTIVSGFRVVPNEDLRAERSWSFEAGINQLLGENIYCDLALFRTDYWDLIEGSPDITNTIRFANLTRARISGAEINLKTSWWQRHLGLDFGYTFMDPIDISLNKTLVYRPKHLLMFSFSFNYGFVGLNLDYRYYSRIEEVLIYPDDDRVPQKVLDAKLAFNWRTYQLAFDIDNALQYHYVPVERNIAPLRKFMVTLSGEF